MDLLQLESVPTAPIPPPNPTQLPEPESDHREDEKDYRKTEVEDIHERHVQGEKTRRILQTPPPTMDAHPTVANPKSPPLRRAALHFLTLLIRACISRVYDKGPAGMLIPDAQTTRARTTLGYVASTDEDAVVRVMAREAREGLGQLSSALVGL